MRDAAGLRLGAAGDSAAHRRDTQVLLKASGWENLIGLVERHYYSTIGWCLGQQRRSWKLFWIWKFTKELSGDLLAVLFANINVTNVFTALLHATVFKIFKPVPVGFQGKFRSLKIKLKK